MECFAAAHGYDSLQRRFQAQENEWTVLAAVVATEESGEGHAVLPERTSTVVSLATGNKCIGPEKMSREGFVLNDCHAEVLAARGFRLFLMNELRSIGERLKLSQQINWEKSFLVPADEVKTGGMHKRFKLNEKVRLHLVVSELPCGDCSIVPEFTENTCGETTNTTKMRYSGAKPIDDPTKREDDQELGILRRKSGRHDIDPGARSLSASCSDKIARWNAIGIQGSLLTHYLNPVRLHSVVVTADCFSPDGKQRTASEELLTHIIAGKHLDLEFEYPSFDPLKSKSVDHCYEALLRGLQWRVSKTNEMHMRVSKCTFQRSMRRHVADLGNKKRKQGLSASGLSIQWVWSPDHHLKLHVPSFPRPKSKEMLQTLTGIQLPGYIDAINQTSGSLAGKKLSDPIQQFRKRPRTADVEDNEDLCAVNDVKTPSTDVLPNVPTTCKANLMRVFSGVMKVFGESMDPTIKYEQAKQCLVSQDVGSLRSHFFGQPTFSKWLPTLHSEKSSFECFTLSSQELPQDLR